MKTKLKGAIIGHSLLKKKSEALSKRFRTVIGLINELKREMVQAMQSAMFSLAEMNYVMGDDVKHQILENTQTSCFRLKTGYENISGVYLPIYECSLRDISGIGIDFKGYTVIMMNVRPSIDWSWKGQSESSEM